MTVVDFALQQGAEPALGAQATGQKNDPPLSPASPYLHGPAGLFNRRDLENPLISAIMGPMMGAANAIPVFNGSRNIDGEWGGEDAGYDTLLTGVTSGAADTFSNQPTTDCAVGPVGGLIKLCTMVNTFGNYTASTREVSMYRAGRVADRVDARFLSLINSMPAGMFATPSNTPSMGNAVNNELASRIFESVLSFQRMFAPRVYTGSPANNSGSRRDIVGLATHINAGNHVDATNSAVCTAADSDIKNFQFELVRNTGGRNIMQYIEMCDKFIQFKAQRQGAGAVDGFIAMRPELWWEISEVIPVQKYERVLAMINRVTNGQGMVSGREVYEDRDQLRASHLIPVNGRLIQVVEDDTIPELNVTTASQLSAGQYASDIYFVPRFILGNFPVTFWEFFDHGNNQANAIQAMVGGAFTFTTDGGMFRWFVDFARGCIQLKFQFTPRLRVRTPQYGWRITNVSYAPLQHLNSWDPASSYFVNGGVNEGGTQTFYTAWSTTTPVAL